MLQIWKTLPGQPALKPGLLCLVAVLGLGQPAKTGCWLAHALAGLAAMVLVQLCCQLAVTLDCEPVFAA